MTEASGSQTSGGSAPTAASYWMPPQWEFCTGNVPEGHLGTTPEHPPPDWHQAGQGPGDHAPPTPQTTTTEEHGPL